VTGWAGGALLRFRRKKSRTPRMMSPIATAPPPTAPPIIAPVFEEPPPPPEEGDVAAAGRGAVGTGVVVTIEGPAGLLVVGGEVVTVDPFGVVGLATTAPGVQLKRPEESGLCTTYTRVSTYFHCTSGEPRGRALVTTSTTIFKSAAPQLLHIKIRTIRTQ